jgi:hypothetical protein
MPLQSREPPPSRRPPLQDDEAGEHHDRDNVNTYPQQPNITTEQRTPPCNRCGSTRKIILSIARNHILNYPEAASYSHIRYKRSSWRIKT